MTLVRIHEQSEVILDLRYATTNNFVQTKLYEQALCFLHVDAEKALQRAIQQASYIGYYFRIFDAFRPHAAAQRMWEVFPNPDYVADPQEGSHHTRGVAVDLTLIDRNGVDLDMGTPFDSFDLQSHHGSLISPSISQNRYRLMGIMHSSGWTSIATEWWHYQLPNAATYPLIRDLTF